MTTELQLLSYGGGRQTVAMLELVRQEKLPRPDKIVIADTGREKQSTWDYLEEVGQSIAAACGLVIEIAPRSLAYVDMYAHNGDLLIPAYTQNGKLTAFCSDEWKRSVVSRYMKLTALGYTLADIQAMPSSIIKQEMKRSAPRFTTWIGFALDERSRVKSREGRAFPLLDLGLTKRDCIEVIRRAGLPLPPPSACWMCPNLQNEEWRYVRDTYPADFERACLLDQEIRENDLSAGGSGVWLHHSRVPLREADLSVEDRKEASRQCGLGMCFI